MSCWGWLYLAVAGVVSIYYGCRGVLIEQYVVELTNATKHNERMKLKNEIMKLKSELSKNHNSNDNSDVKEYPKWEKPVWTHYIQGFILHFVSSVAGFFALYILYNTYIEKLYNTCIEKQLSNISTGTGATIIFLSVLSIIGISGELPYVIKFRKIPGG